MSSSEPVPLETYALALAHLLLRRSEPIASVLDSLQLSAEVFREAEEHWTRELAQSLVRRKGMLAMKFASAFAEARRQVGLLDPNAEENLPDAPAPGIVRTGLPTYLRKDQEVTLPRPPSTTFPETPPAPPAAIPASLRKDHDPLTTTLPAVPIPAIAPLPFVSAGSAAAPYAKGEPRPPSESLSTGTALLDADAAIQAAIPWDGGIGGAALPLTIEAYAALSVDLAQKRADYGAILTRYGLQNAEEHQRVDAAFRALLHHNPALRAKYEALVMRYSTRMGRG